jgi:hypothetical protein
MRENILYIFIGSIISYMLFNYTLDENAKFAQQESKYGRLVSNEAMLALYPTTYRYAFPQYLERDFEQGSFFIR